MSRQAAHPGPWYHGTGRPGGFEPGQELTEEGARRESEQTGGGMPEVWITPSLQAAAHHARNNAMGRYDYFGQGDAHPRVYEMEPLEGLDPKETGARVKRARVVREVPFKLPNGKGHEQDKGYYPWGGGEVSHPPAVLDMGGHTAAAQPAGTRFMPMHELLALPSPDFHENTGRALKNPPTVQSRFPQIERDIARSPGFYGELEESMRTRGQTAPVSIDTTQYDDGRPTLGGGHHRIYFAHKLGWPGMHVIDDPESGIEGHEDEDVEWNRAHPFFSGQRRHAAADPLGGCKEEWQPGERPHFEYHCLESDDSNDAALWHRSHQQVQVLHRHPRENTGGWEGSTFAERTEEGAHDMYHIRFGDGHEGDVFEDELVTHPKHFYRPDPPPMPKQAAAQSGLEYHHLLQGRKMAHPFQSVMAADGGTVVGHLSWGPGNPDVQSLWVHPDYRHRGIATALWGHAQALDRPPQHSLDRSDAGDAWARSVTPGVPDRKHSTSTGEELEQRGQASANVLTGRLQKGGDRHITKIAARPRIPRGNEACGCCSGTGEHADGHECYRCDASGYVENGSREPYCPGQSEPKRRHWREGAVRPEEHTAAMASDEVPPVVAHFEVAAMAWNNEHGDKGKYTPVSVRDAGFAGLVGDSEDERSLREELGEPEPGHRDPWEHFDEDLHDNTAPEPTEQERREHEEDGESESYTERHDQAYEKAFGDRERKIREEDAPDHEDPGLRRFREQYGSDTELWKRHGTFGGVSLKQPIYATQSHVAKEHIEKYTGNRDAEGHAYTLSPDRDRIMQSMGREYLGDKHPLFVTHEGRVHVIEGHHRVATDMATGRHETVGWHFNLDAHPALAEENEGEYPEGYGEDEEHHQHKEAAVQDELPELHRGIAVKVPPEVHTVVSDETRPMRERAQHLLDHVTREGLEPLGQHWTTSEKDARFFTHYNSPGAGGPGWQKYQVVFHAAHPGEHAVIHDPAWREEHEVNDEESEVPVEYGTDMDVHGITWRHKSGYSGGTGPVHEDEWHTHRFAEPQDHTAAVISHFEAKAATGRMNVDDLLDLHSNEALRRERAQAGKPVGHSDATRVRTLYDRKAAEMAQNEPAWGALDEPIRSGTIDPVLLERSSDGHTVVSEGGHRIVRARQLGVTHLPVSYDPGSQAHRYEWDDPEPLEPKEAVVAHFEAEPTAEQQIPYMRPPGPGAETTEHILQYHTGIERGHPTNLSREDLGLHGDDKHWQRWHDAEHRGRIHETHQHIGPVGTPGEKHWPDTFEPSEHYYWGNITGERPVGFHPENYGGFHPLAPAEGALVQHFGEGSHPKGISHEELDARLEGWFHPQKLEADKVQHPVTGWGISTGRELRVSRPPEGPDGPHGLGPEGPAEFDVWHHPGLDRSQGMFARKTGTEPIQHVYRGVSAGEWQQAQQRGYLSSDQRGTISSAEGTNAAVDPRSAVSYLPGQGAGHVLKIRVHPDEHWFTIRSDNYLRTRHQIPLSRVEGVSPQITKGGKYNWITDIGPEQHTAAAEVVAHFDDHEEWESRETSPYAGQPLFHGTRSVLHPGEMISHEQAAEHPNNPDIHAEPFVHATASGEEAHEWGERASSASASARMHELGRVRPVPPGGNEDHAYPARVYQVEPTGDVEPDPHKEGASYRSAAPMRVVREVHPLTCWAEECDNAEHWPDHPHYETLRQEDEEDEGPGERTAALTVLAALENPYTHRSIWYHGTQADPADIREHGLHSSAEHSTGAYQDPESETDDSGHWNAMLGVHFTADHQIAGEFARGEHEGSDNEGYGGEDEEHHGIIHAHVHLKNPKFYDSEHDLDHDAYEHEFAAGNHPQNHHPGLGKHYEGEPDFDDPDVDERLNAEDMWPHAHRIAQDYGREKIPASTYGHHNSPFEQHPMRTGWLNTHPDKYGIAMRHKQRLMDQGYDGVVYRNEYERSNRGGAANTSIIAFHPERQVEITQHHDADQAAEAPDPEPGGHLATLAMLEPRPEVVTHFAATDWGRLYDKIPAEIHRGLFAPESHHVFSMPASDEDVAHMLIDAHQREQFPHDRDQHEKFGTHWTASEDVARDFAHEHEREHAADDQDPGHDHEEHFDAVPVVFHARKPEPYEIEEDPRRLGWQNVDDHVEHEGEREVPIKHGAPVTITGVSWLKHTGLGPMWHRHDLREPRTLRAEDRDSPEDENEWNGDRPEPGVVNHFAAAAGKPAQLKMFHWPHQRQPCPDCGYKLGGDEEDQLKHIRHVTDDYEPATCEHCGHDENLPREHAEKHHDWLTSQDWYTDWDEEGPGDTIHRGFGADLPDEVHRVVHDQSLPVKHRAQVLMKHLLSPGNVGGAGVGNFWSGEPDVSKTYAESYRRRFGQQNEMTPVMLHAHTPSVEHFETDPDTLQDWGVYSYHNAGNREVPLQNQAPVRIKGVSWAPPGHRDQVHSEWEDQGKPGLHHLDQDPAWVHHEVGGEGIRAHATVIDAEAQARTDADLVAHFAAAGDWQETDEHGTYDDETGLRHHPEKGWWCHGCQAHHDSPQEVEEHDTAHTDWDEIYPEISQKSLHRGISVHLPQHLHEAVHDGTRPVAERARLLSDHLATTNYGTSWSTNPDRADHYAYVSEAGPGATHVIMRAHMVPRESIETDPDELGDRRVLGYDKHEDQEVPLRRGAAVNVHTIEWRRAPARDGSGREPFTSHTFGDRQTHLAAGETRPYVAPPEGHQELMGHLGGQHGVSYSGGKDPSEAFLEKLHGQFHAAGAAHQHEDAGQSREDLISHFFTPAPPRKAPVYKPEPERLDDNEYSIGDVSRRYDWEGFSGHEIEHLVRHPEHATFTREDVPVHSLRQWAPGGKLKKPITYKGIARQGKDERDRLDEVERGMDQGATPPIVVVRDGEHHIIADGSHRSAIAAERGHSHIEAFVTDRTKHDGERTAAAEPQYVGGILMTPERQRREERGDRWHEFGNRYSEDLHRGIHTALPPELHAYVHDEEVPREKRAMALQQHLADSGQGLGMHWTPHVNIARRAIGNAADAGHGYDDGTLFNSRDPDQPPTTDVMLHIRKPGERNRLPQREHDEHDIGWQYSKDEDEVPLRPGSPVRLTGVSWRPHDPEHDMEPFEHVDFAKPIRHTSSRQAEIPPPPAEMVVASKVADKTLPAPAGRSDVAAFWGTESDPEPRGLLEGLPGFFGAAAASLDALAASFEESPAELLAPYITRMADACRNAEQDAAEVAGRLPAAPEGAWTPSPEPGPKA